jgi:putative autotransporter adhesin-like protein
MTRPCLLRWPFLACLPLALSCVETFEGNGVPAAEARTLAGFDQVLSRGVLDVRLVRADQFAVNVRIDSNLLQVVRTSVSGGQLTIDVDGGNLGEILPGPHLVVSMPSLLDAELTGSGKLSAEGFTESEPVSVELSGSGELSWSGSTPALDAILRGSGAVDLVGTAKAIDLYLAGTGKLDATSLTASGATIQVEGPGAIEAVVNGPVDATVSGGGSIELTGKVVQGTWDDEGGGKIIAP